nr:hypothetical protein [Tanacetum cinerariifolium]
EYEDVTCEVVETCQPSNGKVKLKKATKRKNVWESYKHIMELVMKPEVTSDIKIIPKTKSLNVIVIKENDDSIYEVISEFKWGLFGYKEWGMMLVILKRKKKEANAAELKSTPRK